MSLREVTALLPSTRREARDPLEVLKSAAEGAASIEGEVESTVAVAVATEVAIEAILEGHSLPVLKHLTLLDKSDGLSALNQSFR